MHVHLQICIPSHQALYFFSGLYVHACSVLRYFLLTANLEPEHAANHHLVFSPLRTGHGTRLTEATRIPLNNQIHQSRGELIPDGETNSASATNSESC
jgi:hypothetical protein